MRAIILAGGKGSQLLPFTSNLPKPVLDVGNIPLVCYQLAILKNAGIKEVVLCLAYQPRKIKDFLGDGAAFGMLIRYTIEPFPMGTAGAFRNASAFLDQTVLVLNGDILTSIDLSKVIEKHQQKRSMVTMVYGSSPQPQRFGLILHNRQNYVTGFIEKPQEWQLLEDHANVGVYIFEKEILDYIPPDIYYTMERELFPDLVAKGINIYAYKSQDYWIDIGDPRSFLQANFDVMAGKVDLPDFFGLFKKESHRYSSSIQIDDRSLVDPSCLIKPGVMIENSVIGCKCRIEEKSFIKDSVIMPGTTIQKNAHIRYSVLGKNCVIGTNVQIKNGVFLGDKTSISDYSHI